MAKIKVTNADLRYFKPVINDRHNTTYRWLLNEGYTVGYLCLCLGVRAEKLSGIFREPHQLTIRQVECIILLLKGVKTPSEVISTLYLRIDSNDTKLNEELKQLYNEIVLPVPSRSVPVHRLDYEPKKIKD